MKIAVLSSHTPSLFWFRMDMMKSFLTKGHEVIAVGDQDEDLWEEKFSDNGISYRKADIQRNGTNPLQDLKTFCSLKKILAEERPDKIFAYQAKTIIYGALAANAVGIKEVYPLIAGVGSVFLSDALTTKLVRLILKAEYRFSMRNCSRVFFQNKDDEEVFRKHGILKRQSVVLLHGSGVNLKRFEVQPQPKQCDFLYIGRLIRDKGVMEYLEACRCVKKKYPQVRCLLVGPFDTNPSALRKEELQPYLDAGIVEYFGEQADVRPYLAMCSVFVLPSYHEGTPKTVLEAMACQRAIITTDVPGCRETVKDGKNGYLVPPKDVKILAEKMKACIDSPETVHRMAAESRKMAEELFDVRLVNQVIEKTMEL